MSPAEERVSSAWNDREIAQRLPWLLVFRGVVATVLLVITLFADLSPELAVSEQVSFPLYSVSVGIYFVVILLGVLLKQGASPLILASVHLAAAVLTAFMVVDATGAVLSGFSFLYLLAIMDAAIVGGRAAALIVASSSVVVYGLQLVAQLYGFAGGVAVVEHSWRYARVFATHLAAFYMTAWLAGHLAALLRSARLETTHARASLARAEELQAVVLEALPLAVLTFDEGLVVRSCNAATAGVLGRPSDALIDQPLPAALASAARGSGLAQEVVMRVGDEQRTFSASCSRVSSAVAGGIGILVLEDRTQVHALERSLEHKERLASLGTMAAGIAHELRNPLAAISGAVELLRAESSATSRAALEQIVSREIDRLNAMVGDFLLYARPLSSDRQRVNLADLVREVCAMAKQDPRCSEHALAVEAPERLDANIDAGQLRQVLWNLLRNAIEASPASGGIEVRLLREESPAAAVLLEVNDEGEGVAPEARAHIFEPFHSTKPDGTGLGLAIVHRLVEAHGGRIDLVPRAPRGTVARVRLPL